MGQPTAMASNGLPQGLLSNNNQFVPSSSASNANHIPPNSVNSANPGGHNVSVISASGNNGANPSSNSASNASTSSNNGSAPKKARSGYNEKAMAQIRNSLRPFQQQHQLLQDEQALNLNLQYLLSSGLDEELARRLIAQSGGQLDAATELLIRQHASLQFPSHNGGNVKVNHDGARSSDPNGPPPALPPRSHHHHLHQSPTTPQQQPPQQLQPLQQQQQHHHHSQGEPPPPPRVPILTPQSGNDNGPPPPPPPRKSQVPPPTPPRGSTPPPSSSKASVTNSMLRRMSPVPGRGVAGSAGPSPVPSSMALNRGTSPVVVNSNSHHHPLRVQNSREIQQQLQQTLQNIQSMSIFPMEGSSGEPPPPYPMGTAAQGHTGANPPPSYTQSLAMRQSPTLSSTSSDYRLPSSEYRRSPGPNLLPTYHPYLATGGTGVSIAPTSPAPSPASSMLSSSSRTSSSMQAWSARQTKTHSPIIMQSVKSTQVQKPVLQTATPLAQQMAQNEANASSAFAPSSPMLVQSSGSNSKGGLAPSSACVGTPFEGGNGSSTSVLSSSVGSSNGSKAVPPPSYEFSIQQKHHGPKVALPPSPTSSRTTPTDLSQPQLPPPPPYPSTAVSALNAQKNEESGLVSGKYLPVISTAAKVMLNSSSGGLPRGGRNEPTGKPPLQRKYSPSESTMISTSRSESPNSDSVTVSAASPLSFMSSEATTTSDSGLGSEPKTTHHTSPKPERKKLSPEKEVSRRESLVIKWEQTLNIPRVPRITKEAEDLIKGLCVNADRRLGREGGSADIKHHPFFHGIDFSRPLRNQKAPYKPDILHELDTSNFDPIDEDGSSRSEDESNDGDDPHRNGKSKKDYHGFYEFTFRRFFDDGGHPLPLEESGGNGSSNSTATASSGGSTSGILPPDPIYV
ncbi:hypothetical protein TCAL_03849 [Tigriopus californicus]|uniref:non-specific serine/threonine protein kinase n=1 Tax=Tigriopus californicus TaxID=6832 RepID=A0A553PFB0_TIGCA|nr:hypothetical protein TCAL_03849 [Tigriopus californicus]